MVSPWHEMLGLISRSRRRHRGLGGRCPLLLDDLSAESSHKFWGWETTKHGDLVKKSRDWKWWNSWKFESTHHKWEFWRTKVRIHRPNHWDLNAQTPNFSKKNAYIFDNMEANWLMSTLTKICGRPCLQNGWKNNQGNQLVRLVWYISLVAILVWYDQTYL